MKVKELIKKVNEYKEHWTDLDSLEACIRADFHPEVEKVSNAMNPYRVNFGNSIMATDVYKCEDGYVGIQAGYASFGEHINDRHPVVVTEFIEFPSVSYRPKK